MCFSTCQSKVHFNECSFNQSEKKLKDHKISFIFSYCYTTCYRNGDQSLKSNKDYL